jgi:hypothetical protein
MPTDGRPDSRLHDWLASRIEGTLTPLDEPDSLTGPLDRDRPHWAPDEEDLETVRSKGWLRDGGMSDDDAALDPATARMHHLPVSFIGESVMDPVTANDPRTVTPARLERTVRRRSRGEPARPPDPAKAPTVRRWRPVPPAEAPTVLRRIFTGRTRKAPAAPRPTDGRLSAPVAPEAFPVWDYAVFSVGMLAVFLCAFGIATWYWVV